MAEVNYTFWSGSGGAGYLFGEINAVYNAEPFKMEGQQDLLKPYFGGGLLIGWPMGTGFTGGLGYGVFGGITGTWAPYTWYTQLKYASGPITFPTLAGLSWNALGAGLEFGIRMPL